MLPSGIGGDQERNTDHVRRKFETTEQAREREAPDVGWVEIQDVRDRCLTARM